MNTQPEYDNDPLREHLIPEMAERAPSGFTGKVMTIVSLESRPVKIREKLIKRTLVPLISVTVTLILTGIVLLLPANSNEFGDMPWMKIIKDISIPAFKINLDSLFSFAVPGYLPYLFICILFLTFFDRGLNSLFHRGKYKS